MGPIQGSLIVALLNQIPIYSEGKHRFIEFLDDSALAITPAAGPVRVDIADENITHACLP
jgi:hypothetical protein